MRATQSPQHLGQSIWFDNITRHLLDTAPARYIQEYAVNAPASNPAIFESAISNSPRRYRRTRRDLNPPKALFNVFSKTFTTVETMTNSKIPAREAQLFGSSYHERRHKARG